MQDRVINASFGGHGDFQAEKYSVIFLWKSWNVNNEDEKKKGHFLYIKGSAVLIATSSNLLDTKYKFYGFNDDLRETINQ